MFYDFQFFHLSICSSKNVLFGRQGRLKIFCFHDSRGERPSAIQMQLQVSVSFGFKITKAFGMKAFSGFTATVWNFCKYLFSRLRLMVLTMFPSPSQRAKSCFRNTGRLPRFVISKFCHSHTFFSFVNLFSFIFSLRVEIHYQNLEGVREPMPGSQSPGMV